jgi:hypothetical protein
MKKIILIVAVAITFAAIAQDDKKNAKKCDKPAAEEKCWPGVPFVAAYTVDHQKEGTQCEDTSKCTTSCNVDTKKQVSTLRIQD